MCSRGQIPSPHHHLLVAYTLASSRLLRISALIILVLKQYFAFKGIKNVTRFETPNQPENAGQPCVPEEDFTCRLRFVKMCKEIARKEGGPHEA